MYVPGPLLEYRARVQTDLVVVGTDAMSLEKTSTPVPIPGIEANKRVGVTVSGGFFAVSKA